MGKRFYFVSLILVSMLLAGCANSNTKHAATITAEKISATSVATPKDSSDFLKEIRENPRKGGVREYKNMQSSVLDNPNEKYIDSYLTNEPHVQIDYHKGRFITAVPICAGETAHFVLLLDGQNIGEGNCGSNSIISFTTPKLSGSPKISFKITGTEKFEVAFYQSESR